ncbi:MAG: TIGR04149 family rSAM-modified RiPP [Bacteroidales bacterium]|nr:TIGR04149 family rSAM-modified RiPP [Bacteroidales bacterium]
MKENKELKKLDLQKQEIINLNEQEMDSLKGGSSAACVASVTMTIQTAIETYNLGKEESWWNCPTTTPTPDPSEGGCGCGCTPTPDPWGM